MWASIAKWLVTSVLLPLLTNAVAAWVKSREKAARIKERIKGNQKKVEAYEADPSDDNYRDLP